MDSNTQGGIKVKCIQTQKGFTLIEMMIVLLVISVLLLITVPNIGKHNQSINAKGCEALQRMVEAQVQSYEMETGHLPNAIADLVTDGYLKDSQTTCPNGDKLVVTADGSVAKE